MNNDKKLRWSRRLGIVPRWVVVPTIQRQTVAEHVFHVTRTALWLVRCIPFAVGSAMSREFLEHQILVAALEHDDEEAATGDNPSPTKPPKDFSRYSYVDLIIKVSDMLESIAFLTEEKAMGNTRVEEVYEDALSIYQRACEALSAQYVGTGYHFPASHQLLEEYLSALHSKHPGLEARPWA